MSDLRNCSPRFVLRDRLSCQCRIVQFRGQRYISLGASTSLLHALTCKEVCLLQVPRVPAGVGSPSILSDSFSVSRTQGKLESIISLLRTLYLISRSTGLIARMRSSNHEIVRLLSSTYSKYGANPPLEPATYTHEQDQKLERPAYCVYARSRHARVAVANFRIRQYKDGTKVVPRLTSHQYDPHRLIAALCTSNRPLETIGL